MWLNAYYTLSPCGRNTSGNTKLVLGNFSQVEQEKYVVVGSSQFFQAQLSGYSASQMQLFDQDTFQT